METVARANQLKHELEFVTVVKKLTPLVKPNKEMRQKIVDGELGPFAEMDKKESMKKAVIVTTEAEVTELSEKATALHKQNWLLVMDDQFLSDGALNSILKWLPQEIWEYMYELMDFPNACVKTEPYHVRFYYVDTDKLATDIDSLDSQDIRLDLRVPGWAHELYQNVHGPPAYSPHRAFVMEVRRARPRATRAPC